MELQDLIDFCLSKKATKQEFPFDDTTLVCKVGNKMFALISLSPPHYINLKRNPITAVELRQKYDTVTAGYYMHKKHWITVQLDGSLPDSLIQSWIDQSYKLVVQNMSKAEQAKLYSE